MPKAMAAAVALQAQRRGDLDAAREGYIKVLAVQPEDFDVLHMLGVLETQRKNMPEALSRLTQALRERLRQGGKGLVVGLSWLSRAERFGELKSVTLRDLQPLLQLPGVKFVDLQYGDTTAEREDLRRRSGIDVQRLPDVDTFNDMDGLAALIRACDLVVTTSNTTAHLAGAVGASTLLMLPFASGRHWCWHEEREDSPWYPSMRLFRQGLGVWSDIIARVRDAVAARIAGAS